MGRAVRRFWTGESEETLRQQEKFWDKVGNLVEGESQKIAKRLRKRLAKEFRDIGSFSIRSMGDAMVDAMREEGPEGAKAQIAAKVFGETFLAELQEIVEFADWFGPDATHEAMQRLRDSVDPVSVLGDEWFGDHEAWAKPIAAMMESGFAAAEAKIDTMVLQPERDAAKELAGIRVQAFNDSMSRMQDAISKQHGWELDQLERAMKQQKGVRLQALREVADAQRRIVERERAAEQATFERRVGAPGLESIEQQRLVLDRIVKLETEREALQAGLSNDARLMAEGMEMSAEAIERMKGDADEVTRLTEEQVELNRDLLALEPADTYKNMLPIMEEQEARLMDILNTTDEIRQSIALEEAEQAGVRFDELRAKATEMLEDMQTRLDGFVEVASNVVLEIDATQAKTQISELQSMVDALAKSMAGVTAGGIAGGASGTTVNVTLPGGQVQSLPEHLRESADAIERGDI